MARYKYWYIKKRMNPQLGTYYIALGNISQTKAKKHGNTLYGANFILQYSSEEEYKKAVKKLNART